MELFITFTRRPWYRKKRFVIPICSLIALFVGAIIIGVIVSTKAHNQGMMNKSRKNNLEEKIPKEII
jgi:hypothetical protein